ncbi:MAG: hypothetical protein ABIG56_00020 [Candidatus Omnitrophota bacterium]
MKKDFSKYFLLSLVLLLAVAFVVRFAGSSLLRLYIKTGIGDCTAIPILCMVPQDEVIRPRINREYVGRLRLYKFPGILAYLPEGFSVIQETIKKINYKRGQPKGAEDVIYLLHREPGYFMNMFEQVDRKEIKNNYDFIARVMFARLDRVNNIHDTFFIIMKSIFTPYLGNQAGIRMVMFSLGDKKGFLNYSLSEQGNYFDCNVTNDNGDFFKIYIKDAQSVLDLTRVLTIISTVKYYR